MESVHCIQLEEAGAKREFSYNNLVPFERRVAEQSV